MSPGTLAAVIAAGLGLAGALTGYLKARTAQLTLQQHMQTDHAPTTPQGPATSG